jgi:hypothetical protein
VIVICSLVFNVGLFYERIYEQVAALAVDSERPNLKKLVVIFAIVNLSRHLKNKKSEMMRTLLLGVAVEQMRSNSTLKRWFLINNPPAIAANRSPLPTTNHQPTIVHNTIPPGHGSTMRLQNKPLKY